MKRFTQIGAALVAAATLVLVGSIAGCAPTTPEGQAKAAAQTWIDTGKGACDGDVSVWEQEGRETTDDVRAIEDSRYRVEVAYEDGSGRPDTGLIDVRVKGEGAPCVLGWNASSPW